MSRASHSRQYSRIAAALLLLMSPWGRPAAWAGEVGTAAVVAEDATGSMYSLIPMTSGNFSRNFIAGDSIDASGRWIAFGGESGARDTGIFLFDRASGTERILRITQTSSQGHRLSPDGRRYYFSGKSFPEAPGSFDALGYIDLESGERVFVLDGVLQYFTLDYSGKRVAFQSHRNLDPSVGRPEGSRQYYLYDATDGRIRQLTSAPDAIDYLADCPPVLGAIPRITADGSAVVLVTRSTLGVIAPAPGDGCHVFVYDVAAASLRHVVTLPDGIGLDARAVSDDGRWLSFVVSRPVPPLIAYQAMPALLDLDTGEVYDPVAGDEEWPGYDSLVTGDGEHVVFSSQGDLDPRVGNADHNMEVFVYERLTGEIHQVSDTVGGIGSTPNQCRSYLLVADNDASVVLFSFKVVSASACQLDGPQRHRADGLMLGRVRAVRKRPGNRPPSFETPAHARAQIGARLAIDFTAVDPDGDLLTFFAQVAGGIDLPGGSGSTGAPPPDGDMVDHRNGTATFHWRPTAADIGIHHLRIAVFDEGGGEVVRDVHITVCEEIRVDGTLSGVISALFDASVPVPCRDADINGDGLISAADVIAARRQ